MLTGLEACACSDGCSILSRPGAVTIPGAVQDGELMLAGRPLRKVEIRGLSSRVRV